MTFQNIDALNLGALLQIVFSEGVRNQLSQDYREWEQIKRWRVGNTQARELRFSVQSSYGPAAIQYRNPGQGVARAFPTPQQSTVSEHTAKFKEVDATIELEYNLYDRAMQSPEKYAEPLALEIQSKTIGSRRRIAADFYGDGTGVVGTIAAGTALTSPASNKLVFQLSATDTARGGVGMFEYGDILVLKAAAGGASALDTNLATEPVSWKVVSKDRKNDRVTLVGLDASGAEVATMSALTTPPAAGEVFYRVGQQTIPDLTAAISDYATATEVYAGIESLAAADGRTVHGLVMSGALAGTQIDAATDPLDANMIQEAMDTVKVNVGQDQYRWLKMCMAPENHAKLISSRETDRRFNSVEDAKRGIRYFAYQHGNDSVEAYTSEFIGKKRIIGMPEAKGGKKVIEYYGSDYKPVKVQGSGEFMLKPGADGGHVNAVVSYLHGILTLVNRHPASVWTLRNFT